MLEYYGKCKNLLDFYIYRNILTLYYNIFNYLISNLKKNQFLYIYIYIFIDL